MDSLFSKIASILKPGTRIEVHSGLTQHLVGKSDIVLWNEAPLKIPESTYITFKEVIQNKKCQFYSLNKILPFHDFCIALLCSVDYSLNHKLTPNISSRTYASAWRTMNVIAQTGAEDVKLWIKEYIYGRSGIGYTTSLGETLQSSTISGIRRLSIELSQKVISDDDILVRACNTRKVLEISNNVEIPVAEILSNSSSVPESQLDSLRTIHYMMMNNNS